MTLFLLKDPNKGKGVQMKISTRLIFIILTSFAAVLAQSSRSLYPNSSEIDFINLSSACSKKIALVEPKGPHQIGTVTYYWVDPSRDEQLTTDPNDLRQVIAQVFYPAKRVRDTPPVAYVPELSLLRAGLKADKRETPNKIAEDLELYGCVFTHSYPKAMVDDLYPNYPVLIFSPGGNMSRHWHTTTAEELASQGYIVAVISHAYSGMDVFPAGGFLMSHGSWQGTDLSTPEEKEKLEEKLTNMLAADARFVLDRLVMINGKDPQGRFTGRLNTNSVAILGHSRGGSTVSRACSTDSRFKACIIFDNLGGDNEIKTGLRQPQMTIRRKWPDARESRLHQFLALNSTRAYDVVIDGATHFSFSDLPLFDPNYETKDVNAERALRLISDYTLAFLDKHLRKKVAPLLEDSRTDLEGSSTKVFQPKK